ncbi:MAG TPA: lipoprotein insertase outer membrane protein LolB [Methyloversatilis sp.]
MSRWLLVLSACALTACTTLPQPGADQRSQVRALARSERDAAFSLSGRFVVKGPDQSASASLDWQHSSAQDELQINGPLGKVLAQLTRDADGVKLIDERQRVTTAVSLDELARQAFGADLPLTRAAHWVTGRPGSADVRSRDAFGRVSVLTERGWRVEFIEYEDDSPDALPVQIDATDGENSFRLRVDSWYPVP